MAAATSTSNAIHPAQGGPPLGHRHDAEPQQEQAGAGLEAALQPQHAGGGLEAALQPQQAGAGPEAAAQALQPLPAASRCAAAPGIPPPLRPLPVADAVRLSSELLGALYLARAEVRLLAGLQRCLLQCGAAPLPHDLLAGALVVLQRPDDGAGGLALRRVARVLPEGSKQEHEQEQEQELEVEVEGEGTVAISQLSSEGPPDDERPAEGLGPHVEALVQEACWQWCHAALPIHASRRQVAATFLRLNHTMTVATTNVDNDLALWLGYTSVRALAADFGAATTAKLLGQLATRLQEQQQRQRGGPDALAAGQAAAGAQPTGALQANPVPLTESAAMLAQRIASDLAYEPSEAELADAVGALEPDTAIRGEWCALQAALWQQRAVAGPLRATVTASAADCIPSTALPPRPAQQLLLPAGQPPPARAPLVLPPVQLAAAAAVDDAASRPQLPPQTPPAVAARSPQAKQPSQCDSSTLTVPAPDGAGAGRAGGSPSPAAALPTASGGVPLGAAVAASRPATPAAEAATEASSHPSSHLHPDRPNPAPAAGGAGDGAATGGPPVAAPAPAVQPTSCTSSDLQHMPAPPAATSADATAAEAATAPASPSAPTQATSHVSDAAGAPGAAPDAPATRGASHTSSAAAHSTGPAASPDGRERRSKPTPPHEPRDLQAAPPLTRGRSPASQTLCGPNPSPTRRDPSPLPNPPGNSSHGSKQPAGRRSSSPGGRSRGEARRPDNRAPPRAHNRSRSPGGRSRGGEARRRDEPDAPHAHSPPATSSRSDNRHDLKRSRRSRSRTPPRGSAPGKNTGHSSDRPSSPSGRRRPSPSRHPVRSAGDPSSRSGRTQSPPQHPSRAKRPRSPGHPQQEGSPRRRQRSSSRLHPSSTDPHQESSRGLSRSPGRHPSSSRPRASSNDQRRESSRGPSRSPGRHLSSRRPRASSNDQRRESSRRPSRSPGHHPSSGRPRPSSGDPGDRHRESWHRQVDDRVRRSTDPHPRSEGAPNSVGGMAGRPSSPSQHRSRSPGRSRPPAVPGGHCSSRHPSYSSDRRHHPIDPQGRPISHPRSYSPERNPHPDNPQGYPRSHPRSDSPGCNQHPNDPQAYGNGLSRAYSHDRSHPRTDPEGYHSADPPTDPYSHGRDPSPSRSPEPPRRVVILHHSDDYPPHATTLTRRTRGRASPGHSPSHPRGSPYGHRAHRHQHRLPLQLDAGVSHPAGSAPQSPVGSGSDQEAHEDLIADALEAQRWLQTRRRLGSKPSTLPPHLRHASQLLDWEPGRSTPSLPPAAPSGPPNPSLVQGAISMPPNPSLVQCAIPIPAMPDGHPAPAPTHHPTLLSSVDAWLSGVCQASMPGTVPGLLPLALPDSTLLPPTHTSALLHGAPDPYTSHPLPTLPPPPLSAPLDPPQPHLAPFEPLQPPPIPHLDPPHQPDLPRQQQQPLHPLPGGCNDLLPVPQEAGHQWVPLQTPGTDVGHQWQGPTGQRQAPAGPEATDANHWQAPAAPDASSDCHWQAPAGPGAANGRQSQAPAAPDATNDRHWQAPAGPEATDANHWQAPAGPEAADANHWQAPVGPDAAHGRHWPVDPVAERWQGGTGGGGAVYLPAPPTPRPAPATVPQWVEWALERYGGAYCRLSELLLELVRTFVYRRPWVVDEERAQQLPVELSAAVQLAMQEKKPVPRVRYHKEVTDAACWIQQCLPGIDVVWLHEVKDIWVSSAYAAAQDAAAAAAWDVKQRVVRLLAPGSLLPISTLQHLYRQRYGNELEGSGNVEVVRRQLQTMAPEVFVTCDSEVLVLLTDEVASRWLTVRQCSFFSHSSPCANGWSCTYLHNQNKAVEEYRMRFPPRPFEIPRPASPA